MAKTVAVCVSNDLEFDQRVHKVCSWLRGQGTRVKLLGRLLPDSSPLHRDYETHRLPLKRLRGALFYRELNREMGRWLLQEKPDILVANDLDTLPANAIVSRKLQVPLVYDTHEIFTEVPELTGRPIVKSIWRFLEKRYIYQANEVCTVNRSIANWLKGKYGVNAHVVRNMPLLRDTQTVKSRSELDLPEDSSIIILQGGWINQDRGGEEAVAAMQFLDHALLLIIGAGDAIDKMKSMKTELNLDQKVRFYPKMPFEELYHYTANADIGLSLDKATNLNYQFSLPNKFFDYIHAGTPILASDLPELKGLISQYQIGEITHSHDPKVLAEHMKRILANRDKLDQYKSNCAKAAKDLNWQAEGEVLEKIYRQFL